MVVNRKDYSRYLRNWYTKKSSLEKQKEVNSKLEEMTRKQKEVEETLQMVSTVRGLYEQYKDLCMVEETAYKKRRKAFIEDYITDVLKDIFPDEVMSAKITETKRNGYNRVELYLMDEKGNMRNPLLTEGQFCQQLIALSGVVATVHNAGADKVYVDEAFAMASQSNLGNSSRVLNRIQQEGIQAIIISQHPELYTDIPHREIKLAYEPLTGTTSIDSIRDYEGVEI